MTLRTESPTLDHFRHVSRLTDDRGIIEHALGIHPRFTHGYCTDDNARLLLVAVRDEGSSANTNVLARVAARFLFDAQADSGLFRNRLSFERVWLDEPTTEDCWGRALWALGVAASTSRDAELRARCLESFDLGASARSTWLRSACFAGLGAAEVLEANPGHRAATSLLGDLLDRLGQLTIGSVDWPWPERRLTYANAVIPEAMIACGHALGDELILEKGLALLDWLVTIESIEDRLSVTPVGGRSAWDPKPAFDQQPIEVSTITEAAARAAKVTDDRRWDDVVERGVTWFLGNNDVGVSMVDLESGGGYDGLQPDGVNINQGAESTLAMIQTMQRRSLTWVV